MEESGRFRDLLVKWHHQFKKSEKSHYRSATSCRVFNYSLGIPLVVITVVVASDIFGLLEIGAKDQYPWKMKSDMGIEAGVVALLSVLAPVLAALQTFLRFPERAEQHRNAAVKFGILKKEVEKQLALPPSSPEKLEEVLVKIQERDAQILSESPSVGSLSLLRSGFDVKPISRKEMSGNKEKMA